MACGGHLQQDLWRDRRKLLFELCILLRKDCILPSIAGSIVLLMLLSITTTETATFVNLRPLLCKGSLVKHSNIFLTIILHYLWMSLIWHQYVCVWWWKNTPIQPIIRAISSSNGYDMYNVHYFSGLYWLQTISTEALIFVHGSGLQDQERANEAVTVKIDVVLSGEMRDSVNLYPSWNKLLVLICFILQLKKLCTRWFLE